MRLSAYQGRKIFPSHKPCLERKESLENAKEDSYKFHDALSCCGLWLVNSNKINPVERRTKVTLFWNDGKVIGNTELFLPKCRMHLIESPQLNDSTVKR